MASAGDVDGARRITRVLEAAPDVAPGGTAPSPAGGETVDAFHEATARLRADPGHFPPPLVLRPRGSVPSDGPASLRCPLTRQPFVEPVVLLDDGRTYERRALENHLASSSVSPATGEVLQHRVVAPAWAVRAACAAAMGGEVELPTCPITLAAMDEPIVLADGCSYEATAIAEWWRQCRDERRPMTSPTTNSTLAPCLWVPDLTLAWLIDELRYAGSARRLAAVRGDAAALARTAVGLPQADGTTPLMLASRHGHGDAVRLLLAQEGAHGLEARDARGGTALLYACGGGHLRVVDLLLAAGADSNAPGFQTRRTPLMVAAAAGYNAVAERLLSAGARVRTKCAEGLPTVFHARIGPLRSRLHRLWYQEMVDHGLF